MDFASGVLSWFLAPGPGVKPFGDWWSLRLLADRCCCDPFIPPLLLASFFGLSKTTENLLCQATQITPRIALDQPLIEHPYFHRLYDSYTEILTNEKFSPSDEERFPLTEELFPGYDGLLFARKTYPGLNGR